ncbi:hypothetical protein [Aquipuribacter sp. MA13-6]|uniref:hypothetical protein n=1 Tax=unclassified Aquipuribacter TaxID=2635084 RepID=UPI003EF0291B
MRRTWLLPGVVGGVVGGLAVALLLLHGPGDLLGGASVGSTGPDEGYALGWGTLALLNAGLAQTKGHGGLGWFLLSLLLGPLATFLLVVLESPRGAQERLDDQRDQDRRAGRDQQQGQLPSTG